MYLHLTLFYHIIILMNRAYITTAIPYANGAPHIGHALDYIIADIYARFLRQQGVEVRFQAGMDEHGNKVAQKAESLNIDPQTHTDNIAKTFQEFVKKLNISYTDYIRTTDQDHIARCQAIWQKLEPHIYKGTYEGWYCEGCEGFISDKEYEENSGICPDHKKPYIRLAEDNYYLRIIDFIDTIRTKISSDEMKIIPDFRKKEFLNLLDNMSDVSISRPKKSLSWGVEVPGDESQVMYVWIDALSNYITILGYPDVDISEWWPAKVQVIGKDILRFHAGIWPAMLLGLDLPLPQNLLTHGHITTAGEKMSKSLGNVIDPIELVDTFGTDAFRYYFARHISTTEDADFTQDQFANAYNNELANDLGNLVSRLANMAEKYEVSLSTDERHPGASSQEFLNLMNNFQFSDAFDLLWQDVHSLNKTIDAKKPWELAKTDRDELARVLKDLIVRMIDLAHSLAPFLPETSEKILDIFTQENIKKPLEPLFPKLA